MTTSLLHAAGIKCLPPARPVIAYLIAPGIVVRFGDEPWPTTRPFTLGWVRIKENT